MTERMSSVRDGSQTIIFQNEIEIDKNYYFHIVSKLSGSMGNYRLDAGERLKRSRLFMGCDCRS